LLRRPIGQHLNTLYLELKYQTTKNQVVASLSQGWRQNIHRLHPTRYSTINHNGTWWLWLPHMSCICEYASTQTSYKRRRTPWIYNTLPLIVPATLCTQGSNNLYDIGTISLGKPWGIEHICHASHIVCLKCLNVVGKRSIDLLYMQHTSNYSEYFYPLYNKVHTTCIWTKHPINLPI